MKNVVFVFVFSDSFFDFFFFSVSGFRMKSLANRRNCASLRRVAMTANFWFSTNRGAANKA